MTRRSRELIRAAVALVAIGTSALSQRDLPAQPPRSATTKQLSTRIGQPAPTRPSAYAGQARVIDSLATDAIASARLASLSIAVVQGSDTIVHQAWGDAVRERRKPADRETVYRLGSITKQFTAAITLQLVAEGKLGFSDQVGHFLPWVPDSWKSVTVAQLLNHTSGIPSYTALGPAWISRMAEDMVPDTIIALTVSRPLDFAPGTDWRYNNSGYVILGRIIELVVKRPYAAEVQARLAKPFGLSSLKYCPTTPQPPRDAAGYSTETGHSFRAATKISLTQPLSAGGLCSNAIDLVRWNHALHGGHVLPLALYTRMTTPEGPARATHYGFGIGRDTSFGRLHLSHGGAINGFSSSNSYWPDSALSIVVLANTESNEVDALAEQIRRVIARTPLVPRVKIIALMQAQLVAHTGRYEIALPGRKIGLLVALHGGRLLATFDGDVPIALLPIDPHRFIVETDQQSQFAFTVTGSKAESVTFFSGPQRFTGRRTGDAP